MSSGDVPAIQLNTARLLLRPSRAADADRAFEIQSDWEVTRMLRMAAFPPDRAEIGRWLATHSEEWLTGSAHRFAIACEGRLIGMVDIDGVDGGEATLGYWSDKILWGWGHATEAAQ